MDKEQQKKLITEIMNDDAKDGLYDHNGDFNKMVTPVEWLVEQIFGEHTSVWNNVIKRAKQMEKEQRIKDYNVGYLDAKCNHVQDAQSYIAEQDYLASNSDI